MRRPRRRRRCAGCTSAAAELRAGDQAPRDALVERVRGAARRARSSRTSAPARCSCSSPTSPRSASGCAGAAPVRRDRRAPARVAGRDRRAAARATASTAPPLVRALHVELVLTAHPDRGHAALGARPPVRRRASCSTGSTTRAPAASRRRALLDELREVADRLVADRRGAPRAPAVEDEVRRNLFFFESTLFDAVPEVLDELERALGVARRAAGARVRHVGRLATWTATPRSAPTRSRARCCCTAQTALRLLRDRVDRLARRFSHSDRRAAVSPALEASLGARRRRAALAPRAAARRTAQWEPLRTKLGFVEHRLTNTLRPRGARARLRDAATSCGADLALVRDSLGSEHVARRRDPAAAVAGRRVRLPPRRPRRAPVRARSCARRSRALPARLRGRGDEERARSRCSRRRSPPAAAGSSATRRRRPASCCACSTRSRSPATPTGREAVAAMVISMVERAVRRARRAVARAPRGRGREPRCGSCRCSRRSPTSSARRRRWPTLYALRALPRRAARARRPPDVMLGYSDSGKDSGFVAEPVGAARRAGAARRRRRASTGSRSSSSTAAAARPRAAAGARTSAILAQPRGLGARAHPHHRAGRDGVGALRRTRSSRVRSLEQTALRRAARLRRARSRRCRRAWRAEMERLADALARALPRRWSTRTRTSCASSTQVDADRRARRRSTSARGRRRGRAARAASSRCARSRGSSRGRRTGCCCRPGTARARRWREAPLDELQREMAAGWPFFREPDLHARDGALQDRPRASPSATCGSSTTPLARALLAGHRATSTSGSSAALLEITGAAALLADTPALQRPPLAPQPVGRPALHLQVELLARARAGRAEAREPLLATITGIAAGMRNTG